MKNQIMWTKGRTLVTCLFVLNIGMFGFVSLNGVVESEAISMAALGFTLAALFFSKLDLVSAVMSMVVNIGLLWYNWQCYLNNEVVPEVIYVKDVVEINKPNNVWNWQGSVDFGEGKKWVSLMLNRDLRLDSSEIILRYDLQIDGKSRKAGVTSRINDVVALEGSNLRFRFVETERDMTLHILSGGEGVLHAIE